MDQVHAILPELVQQENNCLLKQGSKATIVMEGDWGHWVVKSIAKGVGHMGHFLKLVRWVLHA